MYLNNLMNNDWYINSLIIFHQLLNEKNNIYLLFIYLFKLNMEPILIEYDLLADMK